MLAQSPCEIVSQKNRNYAEHSTGKKQKLRENDTVKVELTPFYLDNQFLNESDLNSYKTPAKHRDIFRDTLIAKKYGEGEVRTHDLLARKQKISSTSPGSNPGPTT